MLHAIIGDVLADRGSDHDLNLAVAGTAWISQHRLDITTTCADDGSSLASPHHVGSASAFAISPAGPRHLADMGSM